MKGHCKCLEQHVQRHVQRVYGDEDEEGGRRWEKTVTLGLFCKGPGVLNSGV